MRPGSELTLIIWPLRCLRMVGSRFLRGEGNEQHQLFLPAFAISKYPVTNAQYQAFVDDGGYTEKWIDCWGLGEGAPTILSTVCGRSRHCCRRLVVRWLHR